MRPYEQFAVTRVARAVAHVCGAISLAGPPILMSVPDYFDAGGPFVQLEPFKLSDRERYRWTY